MAGCISYNLGTFCKMDGSGLVIGKGCFKNGVFTAKYYDLLTGDPYEDEILFKQCTPPLGTLTSEMMLTSELCQSGIPTGLRPILIDIHFNDVDLLKDGFTFDLSVGISPSHLYGISSSQGGVSVVGDTVTVSDITQMENGRVSLEMGVVGYCEDSYELKISIINLQGLNDGAVVGYQQPGIININ